MKQVIDWFEIPVSDMSRAQAFYEAVLQTPLHRENFAGPNMQMMVFKEDCSRGKGTLMAPRGPARLRLSAARWFAQRLKVTERSGADG